MDFLVLTISRESPRQDDIIAL